MRKLTVILLACLTCLQSFGQDSSTNPDLSQDFKTWYLIGLNLRITKKNSITLNHLSSFDINPYQHGFMQNQIGFSHRFNRSWSANAGFAHSMINRQGKPNTTYSRIHLEATHRTRFGKGKLRMDNSVQLEKYFPRLQKFGVRAVISNKWSYYDKKLPLRISPFVRNQIFYYQGGEDITYWIPAEDIEEGGPDRIVQAPNGWHRYRLTVGVRLRLRAYTYMSIFYTLQREFNTGWSPYRELNVPNRSGTRIKRPFNNYSLIGISLNYTIKTY